MARLRATALAARSVLDGSEHDGMLDRVGTRPTPIQPSNSSRAMPSKTEITLRRTKLVYADTATIDALKKIRATPVPWRRLPPPLTQPINPTTES